MKPPTGDANKSAPCATKTYVGPKTTVRTQKRRKDQEHYTVSEHLETRKLLCKIVHNDNSEFFSYSDGIPNAVISGIEVF